jgi:hypothetical protein
VGRLEEEEEEKNEFRGRHFTAADLAAMLSNPWVFPFAPKKGKQAIHQPLSAGPE